MKKEDVNTLINFLIGLATLILGIGSIVGLVALCVKYPHVLYVLWNILTWIIGILGMVFFGGIIIVLVVSWTTQLGGFIKNKIKKIKIPN